MQQRISAIIYGKVQGVFYRASTQLEAKKLGLTGWVKNQEDGTVYLEAQGDYKQVDRLLEWCQQGPPDAKVTRISSEVIALVSNDHLFEIKR